MRFNIGRAGYRDRNFYAGKARADDLAATTVAGRVAGFAAAD
jgi:hypothetical protein